MKTSQLIVALIVSCSTLATAQVPVTVNRTTVSNGFGVSLPAFSGSGTWKNEGSTANGTAGTGTLSGGSYFTSVSGSFTGSPSSFSIGNSVTVTISMTGSPTVIISTNAPSAFTNSVSGGITYAIQQGNNSISQGFGASQSYAVTIIEDATGGGGGSSGTTAPAVTITGNPDNLETISRKSTDNSARKLLGFTLAANTNVTMSSLAFVLSNTTTNSPAAGNLTNIILWKDADGQGTYDVNDTQLGSTTNANGFALFSGLSQAVSKTNSFTYFLTAQFQPTNQTKNSFVSASLSAANISVALFGTNALLATGTVLGKQYGFLDSSQVEDDADAAALAAQISNATKGLSTTSTAKDGTSPSLSDSALPAAAAGAAGVAAAFSNDSLSKAPLSSEFTKPK